MNKKIILVAVVLFLVIVGGFFLFFPKPQVSDDLNDENPIQTLSLEIVDSQFTTTSHSFWKSSAVEVKIFNRDVVDHSFEMRYYDEESELVRDIMNVRVKANDFYEFILDSKEYDVVIFGCSLKCPIGGQIEGLIGFYE